MNKEEEEGNTAFEWEEAEQKAFETLRECLITPPIVAFPDFEKEFLIFTDASNYGIGAVLSQIQNEEEVVIAYSSRHLNAAEKNYSTIEREALAIVYGVKRYRHYTYRTKNLKLSATIGHYNGSRRTKMKKVDLLNARVQQKTQYDKRAKETKFELGDRVLLDVRVTKTETSKKLNPRYQGPYRISKVNSNSTVEIRSYNGGKTELTNVNRLKALTESMVWRDEECVDFDDLREIELRVM
jgi:hypothetical protein